MNLYRSTLLAFVLCAVCVLVWLGRSHEDSSPVAGESTSSHEGAEQTGTPTPNVPEATSPSTLIAPKQPNGGKGGVASSVPVLPKGGKTWHPYISRIQPYELNKTIVEDALIKLRAGEQPIVPVRLFEHGVKMLRLKHEDRVGERIKGYSTSGSFEGHPGSIGVFSRVGDAYSGVAMIPDVGYFRIRTLSTATSSIIEEITQVGGCGNCGPNPALDSRVSGGYRVALPPGYVVVPDSSLAIQAGPDVQIDVCAGITQDAIDAASLTGITLDASSASGVATRYWSCEAAFVAALGYANAVHIQSGSPIRYRLVSIQSLSAVPNAELILDTIKRMDKEDNLYDSARFGSLHTAADQTGADLTVVVRHNLVSSEKDAGRARLVPSRDSSGKEGLDVATAFACCSILDLEVCLVHELAHLSGCAHNREDLGTLDPGESLLTPSAFGFRTNAIANKRYGTVMSYPGAGNCYMPYFSTPLLTLSNGSSSISLGGTTLQPTNNVECLKYSASVLRGYRDGGRVDDAALIATRKGDHWARIELQKCIDLGIMNNQGPTDRVWMNAEVPVTRGEMITLLKVAVEKTDSSYFNGSPFNQPPGAYNPFPTDTETRNSSHWTNIRLFAYNGIVNSSNAIFYVNRNASIGEMVLFARKVFNLGADGGNTDAVAIFEYWRSKFRSALFQRPGSTDYNFFTTYGNGSSLNQPLSQSSGQSWLDETGVLDLEYDTSEGDLHNKGYSVPARRAVFAKMLINLLHWKATPLNLRSM